MDKLKKAIETVGFNIVHDNYAADAPQFTAIDVIYTQFVGINEDMGTRECGLNSN